MSLFGVVPEATRETYSCVFTSASGQRIPGFSDWPKAHMTIFDAENPPPIERHRKTIFFLCMFCI